MTSNEPKFVADTVRRLFALWIDSLLHMLVTGAFLSVPVSKLLLQREVVISYVSLGTFAVLSLGFQACCLKWVGATPGKLMMGLRIVSRTGASELSWMQAFLRPLADALSLFFGLGPRALMFLRFDRTHISDWVAETQVRQFHARTHPPRRRWLLGLGLFLFLSGQSFHQSYQQIQHLKFTSKSVVIMR